MFLITKINLFRYFPNMKLKIHSPSLRFNNFLSLYKFIHSWKIVFYGTDEISKVTLDALNINRMSSSCDRIVDTVDVVCIKSDCPVRQYATQNKVTVYTWPYSLPINTYDVGVVVSFGHMIPSESILACKYGIINAHPSLLPRWRGAAPIIHTILNGDVETGVTITQVSPNKFDVGNILMQEKYTVPLGCSAKMLTKELSRICADLIMKTLKDLPQYIEHSYPQPREGATLARKIKPHQGNIDWEKESSLYIYRKYKAFDGFFDIYTFWAEKKIVLLEFLEPEEIKNANIQSLIKHAAFPGFCYFHKRRKILFVKCQDGWCGILSVRVPKRGKISAQDFYNGFVSKVETNHSYFHTNDNKNT